MVPPRPEPGELQMHLDIGTLGIIGFLMGVVLSLGFTMLGLLLPGQRALRFWVAAYWLGMIGGLLAGLRGSIPDVLATVVGNTCFVVSNALVLKGVAEHLGRRLNLGGPMSLAIVIVAGFILFDAVLPDIQLRMMLFSVQMMVWDAWTIGLLLQAPPAIKRSTRFAAALFALDILFNTVRLGMLAAGDAGPRPESGPVMAAAFVFGILIALAQSFALVLLLVEQQVVNLRRQARFDGLTGLLNRDAIFAEGAKALDACRRRRRPCAVLMFDLDNFKRVNDQLGHGAGDAVLRHFAGLAREHESAVSSLLARYGGEEFLLVLPGADAAAAQALAERMRRRLDSTPARFERQVIPVTSSIGIAVDSGGSASFERVIAAADAALYRAKADGRNRAALADVVRIDGLVEREGAPDPA